MPEYLSFEDVVNFLGMSEDEVKGLVSEGELRAFRDEDRMKFRKEDVESLAANRRGEGPGVVLPGQESGEEGTILDLDSAVDFESGEMPATSETAVPEVDFGGGEEAPVQELEPAGAAPIDTTGVPESDFAESDGTIIEPAEEEPSGGEEGDTTGVTQEMVFDNSDDLKVSQDESSSATEEAEETFAEDSSSAAAAAGEGIEGEAAEGAESAAVEEEEAVAPAGRHAPRAAAPVAPGHHPVMTVCLLLCAVVMWVLGGLLVDLARVTISESADSAAGLSQSIVNLVSKGDKVPK